MATRNEGQLVGLSTLDQILPTIEVIDLLDSDSTTKPLSANLGKVLKELIDNISEGGSSSDSTISVIDNLNSTSATDALSANQGRVLNEKINDVAGFDLSEYITADEISQTYLTKEEASNTYLTKEDASSTYLTKTEADNYLTEEDLTTYLTKTEASDLYLTKESADNYLTKETADELYLTKEDTVINAATSTDLGGIKIGYEENGNNYSVNLDENDRAYVTVANNSSVYVFPNTFIVGGYATSSELGDYEDFKNAFDNNHVIIGKYQTSDGGYTGYLVFSFAQSYTSAPKFYGTALSEDGTKSYLLTLNCTSDSWSSRTRVATLEEVSMGGSEVSFSRTLSTGTIIGTITIDGTATDIYAPTAGESVSYSQATSDTLGLVKIGYSTSDDDRNYAVELNSDGQMFVNVPWESGSDLTITGGASTIVTSDLTANRALVSNSSGKVAVSAVTSTELGYLDGVTSNIQTQLNGKQSSLAGVTTNAIAVWDSSGNFTYDSSIDINVIQNISSSGGYVYVLTNSNGANVVGGIERTISQIGMAYDGNISRDTSGLFDTVDAANGIITLKTNGAGYYYQIGASSNGKLYHRYLGNASAGDSAWTSTSWSECADVNSANTFTGNNTFSGSNTFTGTNTFTAYADFTAGAGNSGSDMRFKYAVEPLLNVTDDLMKINTIKYIWNHPDENRCKDTFGVSADELLDIGGVCATMVHTRSDEYSTKWVEYDRFGVLAIKGLQEINEKLQNKCNKYEKVLKILSNKLGIDIDEILKE